MTVQELIEKLQKLDPTLICYAIDSRSGLDSALYEPREYTTTGKEESVLADLKPSTKVALFTTDH